MKAPNNDDTIIETLRLKGIAMTSVTNKHFYLMKNVIQSYAWGSFKSFESLFGIDNSSGDPQAEIWMGAHPNGCSSIELNSGSIKLSELIDNQKIEILGKKTADRYGELPFLFKVLAAENALSVQVHPSKEQAIAGFELENANGILLNDPSRNYKDPNHKPELVYALTPYLAMNGFRSFEEVLRLFNEINNAAIIKLVDEYEKECSSFGLKRFFSKLLSLEPQKKEEAVTSLVNFAASHSDNSLFSLIIDLEKQYPNDIGLFAPLFLNVIELQPGEAMFLNACTPHAYIKGTALEIMANSDNVLRAGLTPKHMDVPELVACTVFEPIHSDKLLNIPTQVGNESQFHVPVDDFKFSIYNPEMPTTIEVSSAEIIFAIDANVTLSHSNGDLLTISKGDSAFIPKFASTYVLQSTGKVARAFN